MRVIENLQTAGESLYSKGGNELHEGVELPKERPFRREVPQPITERRLRLAAFPNTRPGNKGPRKRLAQVLERRNPGFNYPELLGPDLEFGRGMVEVALKNIIANRWDLGGMRWIKEAA